MEWTSLFSGPRISTNNFLERKIMRTITDMIARLLKKSIAISSQLLFFCVMKSKYVCIEIIVFVVT